MGAGETPPLSESIMGVINKEDQAQPSGDNAVIMIPEDEEKKKREEDAGDVLFDEEDLSITNEALRLMSLKKELGVDVTNRDYDAEIKGIIELAREAGIKNRNQLMAELKEIDYSLGFSDEPKIKKIYQYMKLRANVRAGIRKMEALRK